MIRAIRWMARNHVAANLLMMFLIVGGLMATRSIKVEIFPETELDVVTVTVAYPGASPSEVEEGIIGPVEEAIFGVEGIKKMSATANEGMGTVVAEVIEGEDVDLVLQDIKSAIDRIITFPQLAERPVIRKIVRRRSVLAVMVHGDVDQWTLRQRAEAVRDGILALPDVTQADLTGIPPYEIAIEVDEATLRRHGLTLDRVAAAVRAASIDLPGGSVKTSGGEILLRTQERRYMAREYADVVVLSKPDGTLVQLQDIATIRDTFQETDEEATFDGRRAAMIEVFRIGDQSPTEVAQAVKAYVAEQDRKLPQAMGLDIWFDRSEMLESRMDLLLKNAFLGLLLVIVVLGLFLQVRLAFWVTLGIPLSVLGALIVMPWLDVSVNMLSLFAFILVLGIVVDDAIIVGENAFTHRRFGKPMRQAAPDAAVEVAMPVVFSILTTVAAFSPLLFVSGMMGKFMWNVPAIVIAVLLVSLVESLFVLPAHLSQSKAPERSAAKGRLARMHARFEVAVQRFIRGPYTRVLETAVRHRYTTVALALALLVLTAGVFAGRHIKMIFMPELEGDVVHAQLTMPYGTPPATTKKHLARMQAEARRLIAEYDREMPGGQTILRNIFGITGAHISRGSTTGGGGHLGEVAVYLEESDQRNVESDVYARRWRARVGEIPGAEAVQYTSTIMHMGEAVDIQLAHEDFGVLTAAAERVTEQLRSYDGLFDVKDSYEAGKREMKLKLTARARALGIDQTELARQVRGAFYGAEALRIQRGRNELRVMVRYPLEERRSLADVASMRIRTPQGGEIPFGEAAEVSEGRGYSFINRTDRRRVVDVTAKANLQVANPEEIVAQLKEELLPRLKAEYPGLSYDVEGQQRERRESMGSLKNGFIVALFIMYALLAIPFRSYSQPLLVMGAIPFGIIGAVGGHLLLGYNMSLLSMMGVVALSGVVVNDSLVLVDFINRYRAEGHSIAQAIIEGGRRRFRPIVLTTTTTFFALVPMLAETSVQARFLVPMAISLAFGVLFATLITLVLLPALYMILEDAKAGVRRLLGRAPVEEARDEEQVADRPAEQEG